jgi:succinate dehydrogenase/fumarate reductase flavoprotein subunit
VAAAVTHTQGGIRINLDATVAGVEGLFAAGADVGGISTGGYSSGLAAALVLGRIAAETYVNG